MNTGLSRTRATMPRTVTRRPTNPNEWVVGQPTSFAAGQEVRWLRNETSLREGRVGSVMGENLVVFDAQQKRHTIPQAEVTQWRPA